MTFPDFDSCAMVFKENKGIQMNVVKYPGSVRLELIPKQEQKYFLCSIWNFSISLTLFKEEKELCWNEKCDNTSKSLWNGLNFNFVQKGKICV